MFAAFVLAAMLAAGILKVLGYVDWSWWLISSPPSCMGGVSSGDDPNLPRSKPSSEEGNTSPAGPQIGVCETVGRSAASTTGS